MTTANLNHSAEEVPYQSISFTEGLWKMKGELLLSLKKVRSRRDKPFRKGEKTETEPTRIFFSSYLHCLGFKTLKEKLRQEHCNGWMSQRNRPDNHVQQNKNTKTLHVNKHSLYIWFKRFNQIIQVHKNTE